jgi:hypothetical protein
VRPGIVGRLFFASPRHRVGPVNAPEPAPEPGFRIPMSPDELRQHLSHALQCRLVLLAEGGRQESPYTSSFSWSNGMRGIPPGSGSGSGAGSFTEDAKDRWTGLETHET